MTLDNLSEEEKDIILAHRGRLAEKRLIKERQSNCTHDNFKYECSYANKDWYACYDCGFTWSE